MKIRLPQIVAVAAMILLMTFLFIKTNVIESDAHNRFNQHLRQLKELDATLDKDVLESRYGLLTAYDLLITEIGEVNRLQVELKNIPGFLDRDKQRKVSKLLNEFGSLQGEKENLLERFKSRNAIINNSLRYFPVATSNLIKNSAANNAGQQESEPLNYLLRDILVYYLLTDTELKPAIAERIEFLQQRQKEKPSAPGKTDLDTTISHARTILRLKPEVDELVGQIISLPTAGKVEEIIELYDSYYAETLRRAETYRLLLYIFSVLLLAYIAFIIVKLKKATAALNAVNENLEQRVHERTEELSWSNTELQKSETKFKDLFDNAPVAYHELDTQGCFRRVNHTEELMLGYTEAELIGRHPAEIIVEKTSRDATTAKLSGKLPLHPVERTFIHKDGSFISVLNEDRLIFDRNGVVTGIRSTLQNITERKLLEEKLQRGQKLESIGQLAAGIAHEINTPTQYVGDNVRFLKDSFLDFSTVLEKTGQMLESCRTNNINPELVAEVEKTIEQADIEYLMEEIPKSFVQALDGIGRISKIVQSMKDFAHPGSTDKRAADLNKSIESTITVASNEWKYVAEIVTDYDKTLPLVPCLIGEFNQVVLNMIVNAAHAISDVNGESGAKGTISISTRHKDDWAEIRISDTGAGIPEDIRKKIFDPFFTTKEVGKGTGQGLAISHTVIVDKHKGLIDVESEVGTGTTFIICLPVHEASEPDENQVAILQNPLPEIHINESNF